MKTNKKQKNHNRGTTSKHSPSSQSATQAFVEHLHELRKRLYYIAASVLFWGVAAYAVQQHLVHILLAPARGEKFIYTSPGGGIDFLFRICIYSALVISLPLIVYNLLRFLEPVIDKASHRFILFGSFCSGVLAIAGIAFGYFIGLPSALHFLLHQFTTVQIQPLVTIQSYLGFVIVYMVGSALLFQLPLFLLFINRIKPLRPDRLFHYERWVILLAFVIAGLMNPSPNVVSQLMVAGPFIVMYQISIGLIYLINRRTRQPVEQFVAQEPQSLYQQAVAQVPALPPRPIVAQPRIQAAKQPSNQRIISDFVRSSQPVATARVVRPKPAAVRATTEVERVFRPRADRRAMDMQPFVRRPLPPLDSWRRSAV